MSSSNFVTFINTWNSSGYGDLYEATDGNLELIHTILEMYQQETDKIPTNLYNNLMRTLKSQNPLLFRSFVRKYGSPSWYI